MTRQYYTITEAVKIIQQIDSNFGIKEFASYTAEKIICPVIYINSLPAYACEVDGTDFEGNLFVCGFCYLTAYWDVKDEIITMVNFLADGAQVTIECGVFKSTFLSEPIISSWDIMTRKHFEGVPPNRFRLKTSKEQANVRAFTLLKNLTLGNVVITKEDLHSLRNCLSQEKEKQKTREKVVTKSNNARKAGRKSAEIRTKDISDWDKSRLAILQLAKDSPGECSANKLAELAISKELTLRDSTTIAKDIRNDSEFKQYLKPRS